MSFLEQLRTLREAATPGESHVTGTFLEGNADAEYVCFLINNAEKIGAAIHWLDCLCYEFEYSVVSQRALLEIAGVHPEIPEEPECQRVNNLMRGHGLVGQQAADRYRPTINAMREASGWLLEQAS